MASWMTASSSATPRNAPMTARSSSPIIEDGVVRGAAELHPPDQSPDRLPEIAFSVEASVRRQGRRQHPVPQADRGGARQGLREPADHHRRAERSDAGARQQVRRASDVPPRRIHRHYRSGQAGPAGTRDDRPDGDGESRPRARSRTSTAPIGACCFGCMAGAGRPERQAHDKGNSRILDPRIARSHDGFRCRYACRCRSGGPRGARPRPSAGRLARPR